MAPGENCCVVPVSNWKDFFYSTRKKTGNKFLPARLKIKKNLEVPTANYRVNKPNFKYYRDPGTGSVVFLYY